MRTENKYIQVIIIIYIYVIIINDYSPLLFSIIINNKANQLMNKALQMI